MRGLPEPVFYVDENLGSKFIAALRESGLLVESGAEKYRSAPDAVWIPEVTNKHWVVVTKDQFREDHAARIALMRHGSKAFVFIGTATELDWARLFIRKIRWVRQQIAAHDKGFVAKIFANGRVTLRTLADFHSRPKR